MREIGKFVEVYGFRLVGRKIDDGLGKVGDALREPVEIRYNKRQLGRLNRQVFDEYFSKACFFREYSRMIDRHVMDAGVVFNRKSEVNQKNLSRFKNAYLGRRAVICGAGKSLEACSGSDKSAVYIALNRALFYDKIAFDFLELALPILRAYRLVQNVHVYTGSFINQRDGSFFGHLFDFDFDLFRLQ